MQHHLSMNRSASQLDARHVLRRSRTATPGILESTIAIETENVSRGVSHDRQHQRSEGAARTLAEQGRRLLFADEVRRLGRREQLLFVKGTAPIRCRRVDYRRNPEFAGRFDQNLMYDAEAAAVNPRDRLCARRQRKEKK
jgi:type IV secretory pathway TraG/TraD family ATPase VirD4